MKKQEWKFWARMFENAPQMSSEIMQGWIDNPKSLKRLLSGLVPNERCTPSMVVQASNKNCVTAMTQFIMVSDEVNPYDFFIDDYLTMKRTGMYLQSSLVSLIKTCASRENILSNCSIIGYAELTQFATSAEIIAEMPEGYVFEDFDSTLALLATLITLQRNGKAGVPLSNKEVNFFYVRLKDLVYVLHVCWSYQDSVWNCGISEQKKHDLPIDSRIFSATVA